MPGLSPEERLALLTANMDTVRAQARMLFRPWSRVKAVLDIDDLMQAGCIGLLEALERYDTSRGVPFSAWARFRIRGSILDTISAASGPETVSIEDEFNEPTIPSEERAIERRDTLEKLLAVLRPRERDLIETVLRGEKLETYAQRNSITPGRASQIKNSALTRIRKKRQLCLNS